MVTKIGEMPLELTAWLDTVYFPGFDSGDPANPDIKISLGSMRTAAATFTNKTFGDVPKSGANNGTVPGGTVVATEYGNPYQHLTSLALTAFNAGLSGDAAAKAVGALVYTFPAGVIVVDFAHLAVGTTIADAVQSDTPEIGLGTVVASGVQATLGAVGATSEDIFEGAAVADVAGTVFTGTKNPTAAVPLIIPAASAHTVYLNFADTWANLTAESALSVTGTVLLGWRFVI